MPRSAGGGGGKDGRPGPAASTWSAVYAMPMATWLQRRAERRWQRLRATSTDAGGAVEDDDHGVATTTCGDDATTTTTRRR